MVANFIPDQNVFQLAGPPRWFCQRLHEYDPSLVIVPSRQGFYYRLAQRRPIQLPERIVNDVMKEQADTRMLASYGLVPITTVMATVRWDNPLIFSELTRRAPWRMGGAQKFEELVLDQDRQERQEQARTQDEHLTYLSKDAWRYYNKKLGLRSHIFDVKGSRRSTPSPSASPSIIVPGQSYTPQIQSAWGDVLKRG